MPGFELNPLERAFLAASRELHEREVRDSHARVRRLRILASVASALFVVAAVVGGLALLQWRNANDAKDRADASASEARTERDSADTAREQAQTAAVEAILARLETEVPLLLKTNRALAFALAAQAHRLAPGSRTTSLMNRVLAEDPRWLGSIRPSEPTLLYYIVSGDGKYVATRTQAGLIEVRDASGHAVLAATRTLPATSTTCALVITNGGLLIDVANNPEGRPTVSVFKLPSLTPVRQITWDRTTESLAGCGDGSSVVAFRRNAPASPTSLRLVDVADGSERTVALPALDLSGAGNVFWFDSAGRHVAANFRTATGAPGGSAILDAKTLELVSTVPPPPPGEQGGVYGWNYDGSVFVTSSQPGNVRLWNSRTGESLGTGKVNNFFPGGFSFGPSGKQLILATDDQKISAVFVPGFSTPGPPYTVGSTGFVYSYFGADEKTFISWAGPAADLEHWSLDGAGLVSSQSLAPGAGRAAVAQDGKWFVKQAADGSWARWSLPEMSLLNRSEAPAGATANNRFGLTAVSPVVSSDGRYIATAHTSCPAGNQPRCAGSVVLWDAFSGARIGDPIPVANPTPAGGPGVVMAFHPGLPLLAVGGPGIGSGPGSEIQIWTLAGATLSLRSRFNVPADRPQLDEMAFVAPAGADRTVLAMRAEANVVSLWDVAGSSPSPVISQRFAALRLLWVTRAGTLVVGDGDDIKFYELKDFTVGTSPTPALVISGALGGSGGAFARLSFSNDGRRMAVAQAAPAGGRISVWDLATKEPIGSSFNWLQSSTAGKSDDAFIAPDGSFVVSSSNGATVVWDLDTAKWAEKVCFAAGRNLTEAEWAKYFPGRDYEVTCPQWPAKPKT